MDDMLAELAFDSVAQQIAGRRLAVLQHHATKWSADDPRWSIVFIHRPASDQRAVVDNLDSAIRNNKSLSWLQALHSAADDMELTPRVVDTLLLQCRGRGWFDAPQPRKQQPRRPDLHEFRFTVLLILESTSTVQERVQALIDKQVCRDTKTATLVAQSLMDLAIMRATSSRLCGIIKRWVNEGPLGLLYDSSYPCYDEIRLLDRYIQKVQDAHPNIAGMQLIIRGDIDSLARGIRQVSAPLWQQHLLTEPAKSVPRTQYAKRLFPRLHTSIIEQITAIGRHTAEQAERLFNEYLEAGFAGIVDWRCATTLEIDYASVARTVLLTELAQICKGLEETLYEELYYLLECLMDAMSTLGIPLSRIHLRPRYAGRAPFRRWREYFGAPKLRTSYHKKRPRRRGRPRIKLPTIEEQPKPPPTIADLLVSEFARTAHIKESEARHRLQQLLSYGAIGLLPQPTWRLAVDERVHMWIELMKLGHRQGSRLWSDMVQRATMLFDNYEIPRVSPAFLHAVYRTTDKPDYWHGGKGLVLIHVHQRAPRVMTNKPRLLESWMLLPFKLRLGLRPGTDDCYVLLVVDEETSLPMGAWMSEKPPGHTEAGLALYQAIWHPGAVKWPIRGIPSRIRMTTSLVSGEEAELRQAAMFLMTNLDIVPRLKLARKSQIWTMVHSIQNDGCAEIQRRLGRTCTPAAALATLLEWLMADAFPAHRQDAPPPAYRERGVAMPGDRTEAAGWLLPPSGSVEVTADGILWDGEVYGHSAVSPPAGQTLIRRAFPYLYPTEETIALKSGFFVQVTQGDIPVLHYVEAVSMS